GDHVGIDIARRDGVDRYAFLGAFLRQRLRKAVDARFGGGIIDLAILARLAVDRPDIDDAAPAAFDHAGETGLGHVETAAQVDAHDVVPIVIAHPGEGAVAGDAGIVDDDIDRADLCRDAGAAVEAGLMVADVPFIGGDAGPIGKFARPFVIAAIVGDDGDAHVAQLQRNGFPDAATAAGDDCDTCHEICSPTEYYGGQTRARAARLQV